MSADGPRRLLDHGDELDRLLRGALEAERSDRVDEARLGRIAQAIASSGTTALPAAPPQVAPATRPAGWLGTKGILAIAAAGAIGALAFLATRPSPSAKPSPTPTIAAAPASAPSPEAPADVPTISPADLPSAPALPTSGSSTPSRTTKVVSGASEADEIALLARAHDALRADPAASLALCREHETRFATGHFAQEREAVAIEALVYMGRKDEAGRRWAAFDRRYPTSSHRVHLASLLSGPAPSRP